MRSKTDKLKILKEWLFLKPFDLLFDTVLTVFLAKATFLIILLSLLSNALFFVLNVQIEMLNTPIMKWQLLAWVDFAVLFVLTASIIVFVSFYVKDKLNKKEGAYKFLTIDVFKFRYHKLNGNSNYAPYCIEHEIKLKDEYSRERGIKIFSCQDCGKNKLITISEYNYINVVGDFSRKLDKMFPNNFSVP